MMTHALYIAVVVAATAAFSVRIVRSVAVKRAFVDVPNERSSHKIPVPRLGGAAFVPVVVVATVLVWWNVGLPNHVKAAFYTGAVLLFSVSLLDDFVSLSTVVRFAVQFLVATSLVVIVCFVQPWAASNALVVISVITFIVGAVGLVNIYNFMDGIDGIAGIQAFIGGVCWFFLARHVGADSVATFGLVVAAGSLGFLSLNWPPAKIFMGDAGSTVLGYIFASIPLLVWVEAKSSVSIGALALSGGLIVWPFLADGVFTIFRRLSKRENIFKAHRSHLYQRLVIAGRSHRSVTLVYGGLAIVGGILAWCVVSGGNYAGWGAVIVVAALFVALWRWTVGCEGRAARG